MARRQSLKTSSTTSSTVPTSKAHLALQTVVSLLALSSSIFITGKVLAPIFGGVATDLYLQRIVTALTVCFTFLPLRIGLGKAQESTLGTSLCMAPVALHRLATLTTSLGNPVLGPILTYTPVLAPIVFSATDGIRGVLSGRSQTLRALTAIATSVFVVKTQLLWTYLPYNRIFSHSLFSLIIGLVVVLSGQAHTKEPTQKARKFNYGVFILPLFVSLVALSQPPTRILSLPYTHPNGLLRIISSEPSVTGRIVVGEDYTHGFRFLRADHSLLGGVWVGDRYLAKMDEGAEFVRDKNGTRLGESIYSAFILQEAARLQEKDTPQENALIIGLGVGIAAQAFMQHGLSTSIVEIDPAVYLAARDYFGVPEPSAVYIEDARGWVQRQTTLGNGTYDIVVHDCFSGGGVPAHLFTSEFWQDLRKVISPDGVLAVNYAGMIGSESSKAVYLSLKRNFGKCRVFHDFKTGISDEELTSEFINLVFFCSPLSKSLTFRPAVRDDYLSSYLREFVLGVLPDREVRPELILGDTSPEQEDDWVLTDKNNPLGAWQDDGALEHWKVMRSVLPDYVWSTY